MEKLIPQHLYLEIAAFAFVLSLPILFCSRNNQLRLMPALLLENLEPRARVELATCRLRIGCSTTELPRLGGESYLSIRGKLLSILQERRVPALACPRCVS